MAVGDAPAVDPNLYGYSDDPPLLPAGATVAAPSIAEQQRQHAEQSAPASSGDSLPLAPAQPPGILDSSWSVAGKQLWDKGSRGVGLGTRDVVEGGTSPVTGALDLATWPMRALQRAFGVPTTAPSDLVTKSLDAAGLPTPQTPTEQNISTFNRGAASVLPSIAVGGMPTVAARVPAVAQPFVAAPTASVPQVARTMFSAGTGAVAGEKAAGADIVPPWLKPTANIVAAIAASRFADVGANLGAKTYNAVAGNMSPTYDAFVRAGVDPRLLGTVAGGPGGGAVEATASRVPFASSILRPVQENTLDQFGNSVQRTAAQLDPAGASVTAQTTGDTLQNSFRNWVANVFNGPQGRQAAAWNPLNQRMAGASVDASPFRAALTDAAAPPNLASMPATQQAWGSGQAQRWLDALNADIGSGNLSWEQAQAIRTRIGDAMGTPAIADAIGMQQLRRMYGALADGMKTSAVQNGQGALFDNANAVTTNGHAFIDNVGSKIAKANNPAQETVTPSQATDNILNSDDTTMQAVRRELPDAADVLAAYKLRSASTAKPSVAGNYDDTSTGTHLTNMNRMQQDTPGGYNALFNTPAIQGQVGDLSEVARALRATERHLSSSNTPELMGWMQYLQKIGEAASELSVRKTAGAITIPPTIGYGLGKLMTSPTATRFGAAQGAGQPLLQPRVAGLLGSQSQ